MRRDRRQAEEGVFLCVCRRVPVSSGGETRMCREEPVGRDDKLLRRGCVSVMHPTLSSDIYCG